MLSSFLTKNQIDFLSYILIIEIPIIFLAMLVLMARVVTVAIIVLIAMSSLTLQDKLGKV